MSAVWGDARQGKMERWRTNQGRLLPSVHNSAVVSELDLSRLQFQLVHDQWVACFLHKNPGARGRAICSLSVVCRPVDVSNSDGLQPNSNQRDV